MQMIVQIVLAFVDIDNFTSDGQLCSQLSSMSCQC